MGILLLLFIVALRDESIVQLLELGAMLTTECICREVSTGEATYRVAFWLGTFPRES